VPYQRVGDRFVGFVAVIEAPSQNLVSAAVRGELVCAGRQLRHRRIISSRAAGPCSRRISPIKSEKPRLDV
jgi:hypothetical protein